MVCLQNIRYPSKVSAYFFHIGMPLWEYFQFFTSMPRAINNAFRIRWFWQSTRMKCHMYETSAFSYIIHFGHHGPSKISKKSPKRNIHIGSPLFYPVWIAVYLIQNGGCFLFIQEAQTVTSLTAHSVHWTAMQNGGCFLLLQEAPT